MNQLKALGLTNGTELFILFMNLLIPVCRLLRDEDWVRVDCLAELGFPGGDVTHGLTGGTADDTDSC